MRDEERRELVNTRSNGDFVFGLGCPLDRCADFGKFGKPICSARAFQVMSEQPDLTKFSLLEGGFKPVEIAPAESEVLRKKFS